MSEFRPEIKGTPEISIRRADKAELGAKAAAAKALRPIRQIPLSSTAPTPQAVLAQLENAKKRVAYGGDRARLKAAAAQSKWQERQMSRALENRDKLAGKHLRKQGARQERFAGQRLKNFARNMGIGPELFRVLRT